MKDYLIEMRDYMPPRHRRFIEAVERNATVRPYVTEQHKDCPALRENYNQCLTELWNFRSMHLQYAVDYIQRQAAKSHDNPTHVGTGGTPFISYLEKHRDETLAHLLD